MNVYIKKVFCNKTGPANTDRNNKNENKEDKPEKSSCCLSAPTSDFSVMACLSSNTILSVVLRFGASVCSDLECHYHLVLGVEGTIDVPLTLI